MRTFFDLETTDKNPNTAEILTAYFKTVDNNGSFLSDIYVEMKPEKYLIESYEFHKISKKESDMFPSKTLGLRRIFQYLLDLGPHTLICHANYKIFGKTGHFDWQVLQTEALYQNQLNWFRNSFYKYKIISTHTIAKSRVGLPKNDLDFLAKYFDIKNEDHHECRNDVLVMEKLYNILEGINNEQENTKGLPAKRTRFMQTSFF